MPWFVVFGHYLLLRRWSLPASLAAACQQWLVVIRSLIRFLSAAGRSDLWEALLVGMHILLRPISLRLLFLFVISFAEFDYWWVIVEVIITAPTALSRLAILSVLAFDHVSTS